MREEQERQRLKRARSAWDAVENAHEALLTDAAAVGRDWPNAQLPNPPGLPQPDRDDVSDILAKVSETEQRLTGYRQALNEARLAACRDQAADQGRAEMEEWYRARGVPSALAQGTTGPSGEDQVFGDEERDRELRRTVFERAQRAMAELERESFELPEQLTNRLAAVRDAPSEGTARVELERLRNDVAGERDLIAKERQRRDADKRIAIAEETAELMARSLESLGYTVSGTDDAAYAENREILAFRPEADSHAVRLRFDPDAGEAGEVTSDVVKLVDTQEEAVRQEMDEDDRRADNGYCSPAQIGRVSRELAEMGINIPFQRSSEDENAIEALPVDYLIDHTRVGEQHFVREGAELRQRAHDRR